MNLLRFDSDCAWVNGVTTFWRDRLRANPHATMCLASGLTPNPIYAGMGHSVRAGQASFAQTTVYALDEFGELAPDDPGRTRNMLAHHLIGRIDLPAAAFHFLDPWVDDVEEECRRYDAAVADGFDLVLLGIGLNGHLGMNEPGSPGNSPTRRVELHETTVGSSARYLSHPNLPRWGLTVGLKSILASKEVWLLASGSAKASILKRTVAGDITEDVPASLLRRHPNCSLFVDAEAGALLS
jgi:glucosamine-6-phosphate isomerase